MPDETLSANSEIVPVGATEVSSALRMPCAAIASRTSASSAGDGLAGEVVVAVEQREGALLRGERGRGEIGRALDRAEPASVAATAAGEP